MNDTPQEIASNLARARAKTKPPPKEKKNGADTDDGDDDATAQELGLNAEVHFVWVWVYQVCACVSEFMSLRRGVTVYVELSIVNRWFASPFVPLLKPDFSKREEC